jgi:hydrogenase maturation protease
MTAGSVEPGPDRAPVLVLGLGNPLLGDDGAGLRILEELSRDAGRWREAVELVDGGTQGLALLGWLSRRPAVVVLDAIALGAEPGSVHVLREADLARLHASRSGTAHESSALELLATARLLGEAPGEVVVVGVEPGEVGTGIGLTPAVERALGPASDQARAVVDRLIGEMREHRLTA